VQPGGVAKEAFEGSVVVVGGVAHGVRTVGLEILARRLNDNAEARRAERFAEKRKPAP
jgi:hypothetical protein